MDVGESNEREELSVRRAVQREHPQVALEKSSKSVANGCVEVAPLNGLLAVRDSRNPNGPVLLYTGEEWRAFVAGVKNGEFDDAV